MRAHIYEGYLDWLMGIVGGRRNVSNHWGLIRQLGSREFVWLIPNDDNRMEDGRELRDEFIGDATLHPSDSDWYNTGCSCLEMLVALARKASFESDLTPGGWFWLMLGNAGLRRYDDRAYQHPETAQEVDDIIDRVIYRNYDSNGAGGFFPLNEPTRDQRRVELWYQLAAYILEDFPP